MSLNGTWKALEAELGGNAVPSQIISATTLVIEDSRYTARVSGVTDKGTISLNTDLVPHAMDITGTDGPNKGKTIKAIYKVTGTELVVCYNLAGDEYPERFSTVRHPQLFMVRYKRRDP